MVRAVVLLVACALAACSGSQSPRRLVLLHTNDEHSHLLGYGPETDEFPIDPARTGTGTIVGGASRRSVVLASERQAAKTAGADVLTVSAGDNMMGTLAQLAATTLASDYQVMSLLQYDVTTLGNHEFDYGPDKLGQIIGVAKAASKMPPVVASNIHFSGQAQGLDFPLAVLFDESGADSSKPIHRSLVLTTPNGLKVG